MHGPLLAAAFRDRDLHRASRFQVVRVRPRQLHQRFRREQLPGFCIQHIEEAVFRNRHRHMTLLAIHPQIGNQDVIVLCLQSGRARLEVPHVFARRCLYRKNAAGEQPVSRDLDRRQFAVIDACARRAENHIVVHRIIGNGIPHVCAADPPAIVARPRLRGHLESFGLQRFFRIAGDCPEAPRFLPGFRIVGHQ